MSDWDLAWLLDELDYRKWRAKWPYRNRKCYLP